MAADEQKIFEQTILDTISQISADRDEIAAGLNAKGLNIQVGSTLSEIAFTASDTSDDSAIKASPTQFGQVKLISSSEDNGFLSSLDSTISTLALSSPYVIPAKKNYNILSGIHNDLLTVREYISDKISQLETSATTLSTNLSTIPVRVTTLETSATTLSSSLSAIPGRVTTLETSVATLETSANTLSTNLSAIPDKVNEIEETLSTKSSIKIGEGLNSTLSSTGTLNIRKVSPEEYAELLATQTTDILSNEMYIISADYLIGFDNKIVDVADGTESTDAATFGQLSALSAEVAELKRTVQTLSEQIAQLTATA